MGIFENITAQTILIAVKAMHEKGKTPTEIHMNSPTTMELVKLFNDNRVIGDDGNIYIWGMKVIQDNRIENNKAYLI